jgi:ABC-type transport system involved in multi-copper enzyme maturation permease subunit
MTASTADAGTAATRGAGFHGTAKVTLPRILRSEWTKLTSLRSTVWTLLAAVVITIGFGLLVCSITVADFHHTGNRSDLNDPVMTSLVGGYFSQIAVGVLGVLLITGEYSTGMIRTSLGAVPHRVPMLAAKAIVFGVTTYVVSLAAILVAFFGGQAILGQIHAGVSIGDPSVVRVLLGGAFFVMTIGLLGIALGTLIRSTGGSIAALLGLIFVVPIVTSFLPGSWGDIQKFIPNNAGGALVTIGGDHNDLLSPLGGFIVLLVWLAVGLGSAAFVLMRRDA